ncbi:CU044_5270 family protein [Micromonospora sp. WMMD964]|nr:CU044_5270 family protein [Micromonospora sp. WMMD964]WFF02977.1 CU044_5270 family protein [Micromonospora sp. WMMD964]
MLRHLDPAQEIDQWPAAPRVEWATVAGGPRSQDDRRIWRRRTVLGAAVTGAAAIAAAAVMVQVAGPSAPVYAATPPPLPLEYETGAPPARNALLQLANDIQNAPDANERAGRFSFVRVGQWSLDMASGSGSTTVSVVPQVISTWRAPDGSGKISTVSLDRSDIGQRPDADAVVAAASRGAAEVEMYSAGELAAVIPDPVPDDVNALEKALYAHQPRANGPESALRAVADLYRGTAVDREVRVAALRFLARTDGVLLRGRVTDRLGRKGLAVSVDSKRDGTRDLLVIDQETGWLLASESVFLRRPERLQVRVPAVFSYTLYLELGRRATMS